MLRNPFKSQKSAQKAMKLCENRVKLDQWFYMHFLFFKRVSNVILITSSQKKILIFRRFLNFCDQFFWRSSVSGGLPPLKPPGSPIVIFYIK